MSRFVVWMFSVFMIVLYSGISFAQDYPNKPIRIVSGPVGGGADFVVRLIAQGISGPLGQQLVVDNRAGPPIIPGQIVAKARPDGYTLLFYGNQLWLLPFVQDDVPYDPEKDFSPISLLVKSPNILVVHPSVPVKSVKELIALAKARPGELNYGSGPSAGSPHLAAESFKGMAGINIVRISYKGSGPALNALLGGEVQLMFPPAGSVTPHVKSGRLRALAVTTIQPSALAPGLPTVAASGLPDYESASLYAIFAPAKTPETIINRLNEEIVRMLNLPDVKERFLNAGVETVGSSPEQLAAAMKSDMSRMNKVIKDAGIKAD